MKISILFLRFVALVTCAQGSALLGAEQQMKHPVLRTMVGGAGVAAAGRAGYTMFREYRRTKQLVLTLEQSAWLLGTAVCLMGYKVLGKVAKDLPMPAKDKVGGAVVDEKAAGAEQKKESTIIEEYSLLESKIREIKTLIDQLAQSDSTDDVTVIPNLNDHLLTIIGFFERYKTSCDRQCLAKKWSDLEGFFTSLYNELADTSCEVEGGDFVGEETCVYQDLNVSDETMGKIRTINNYIIVNR